ncbi:hypothetical protein CSV79_15225 [Sporosarcina sp. P13]|uniref:hypothetical protein n=1 Tax=Sporosarcina sp. P13 TaxID=2048263 RepID=UPI000C16888F|nr:hypothetical protein [Sporosarcina sp. P13]PIC62803.1 hypothetical protein CSV79_15225 [Sporosarcina sp. P13]
MRQIGGLPVWLIAGAIRQRRSEYSDDYLTKFRSGLKCLELIYDLNPELLAQINLLGILQV